MALSGRRFLGPIFAVFLGLSAGPAVADHHSGTAGADVDADAVESHFVRPDVRAYLDRLKANPRPPMSREFLAMVRKIPPEMMSASATGDLPVGELGEVRDVTMPGPGGEMRLRLFDPRTEAERQPGPVVVFYHGGAFVIGSIETHEGLAAEMARQLDLPVVSVDYRLAPENPFPAAPDDAEASARWIAENGAAFGRTFTGLVLSGDSAGGNLTLVTSLALGRQSASLPLIMQIPIYPVTDRAAEFSSDKLFAKGFGLDLDGVSVDELYSGDPSSWRFAPL